MAKKIAIVIGGGVGGLVCATKLAKERKNLEVIILEQHDKVGGFAQGWTRKPKLKNGEKVKVNFELTHAISDFLPGQETHNLYTELGVDWKRIGSFIAAPKFAALRFPKEEPLEILNDFKQNRKLLLDKYEEEARGIGNFFRIIEKLNKERPTKFIDNKILRTLSLIVRSPTLVKYRNHTFKDILDECFQGEEIKTHLSTLHGYIGLPSEEASGLLTSLMQIAYLRSGGALAPAKNSYQTMHEELARVFIEKYSGKIETNSEVTMIDIDKNRNLRGVVVKPKRGVEYYLDADYVVSAGDMKRTLLPLKDSLPKRYVKKLEEMKMSISFISTKAVIKKNLSGLEDKLGYAANVLASSREAMKTVRDIDFPKEYVIYVSVPTILRPKANLITDLNENPLPNYHIVDMVMSSPISYETASWMKDKSKKGYNLFKIEGPGKQMIEIVEKELIPGLEESIQFMDVSTPATYERYGLTTEGAVYTFDADPKQFINRPGARTPIKRLYVTGSSILSAGVVGAISSGELTANTMLKDIKRNK